MPISSQVVRHPGTDGFVPRCEVCGVSKAEEVIRGRAKPSSIDDPEIHRVIRELGGFSAIGFEPEIRLPERQRAFFRSYRLRPDSDRPAARLPYQAASAVRDAIEAKLRETPEG